MSNKNSVPDRWEKYTDMGRIIPGTRFITFKVPLRQEILQRVKNGGWFSPRTLMDHCHNLGLVIDLTDTYRYYDPNEFESRGVTHLKIRIRGRVIPEDKAVQKFFQEVNKFLEKNKENDKVIGVHCTHGINRSGYLVCRYMIQVLGIPPDQAIADFNSARGHELERENYLADLRQATWMNEAVPRYTKHTSTSKDASEYSNNSLLDTSTASSLDTTNNTSLDTTTSEVESPGTSLRFPIGGRSWKIPLLKYPNRPHAEDQRIVPASSWRAGQKQPPVCYRCQQVGHIARVCPNPRVSVGSGKAQASRWRPMQPSASDDPQKNTSAASSQKVPSSATSIDPSLPPACPPKKNRPSHSSSGGTSELGHRTDKPYFPSSAREKNHSHPLSSSVKPNDVPITTRDALSGSSQQGGAQELIECQARKIQELEEMLRKKQHQIEDLMWRLEACRCARV